MVLPHLSAPSSIDTCNLLAECILCDTNFAFDPIFQLLADLDSIDADLAADAFATENNDFTVENLPLMIAAALVHLKLNGDLDVQAIIRALFQMILWCNLGRVIVLTIFILLHRNGLFTYERASTTDLFCRKYPKRYWDEDNYSSVDSRAAISAGVFSDFLLAVCRERSKNADKRNMKSDRQFQQLISLLRQCWPSEFDACLPDCLRIAGDSNDTALVSILRRVSEGKNWGALFKHE